MGRNLKYIQILSILGMVDLCTLLSIRETLAPFIFRSSLYVAVAIIILSVVFTVMISYKFMKRITPDEKVCSNYFSIYIRIFVPSILLSVVWGFFMLSWIHDVQILKVAFLGVLLIWYPILILIKSGFATLKDDVLWFYDYTEDVVRIDGTKIKSIKRVFLTPAYRILHEDVGGIMKKKFFFPNRSLFSRSEGLKQIRHIAGLDE